MASKVLLELRVVTNDFHRFRAKIGGVQMVKGIIGNSKERELILVGKYKMARPRWL